MASTSKACDYMTAMNLLFVYFNNLHVQLTDCTACPIAFIIVPLVIYSCSNLNAVLSNSKAVGIIWHPVGIVEGYLDSSQWSPYIRIATLSGVFRLPTNPDQISGRKPRSVGSRTVIDAS